MKYQLWTEDEYRTSAIVGSFASPESAAETARKLVTDANFSNALSTTDRMRNIEAYFVEMLNKKGSSSDSLFYGGNRRGGKYVSYKSASVEPTEFEPKNTPIRIYVGSTFSKKNGKNEETRIYLNDEKGKQVSSLSHLLLSGKTIYFIVPVDK